MDLDSPLWVASGTFGYGNELYGIVDYSKISAIVTKGISFFPRDGNKPPRILEINGGLINSIGLQNVGVERFCREILPNLPDKIIVNVFGEEEEEYIRVVDFIEKEMGDDRKILGYEINLSCPNTKKGGIEFGFDKNSIKKIVSGIREKTKRVVLVKFTPYPVLVVELSSVAFENGADGVVLGNTIPAASPYYNKINFFMGGLSGPIIKPIALRCVIEVKSSFPEKMVVGCGGIMNGEDAFHYIIGGASFVEIGTANFSNPLSIEKIYNELQEILKKHGLDFKSAIGLAIK